MVKYNRENRSKLQKIYWALYNTVENSVTAYDNNNIAGAKV